MTNAVEAALGASRILLGERNLVQSSDWLQSIGLDVPVFEDRGLVSNRKGVDYEVAANSDMLEDLAAGWGDFGLIGSDKINEKPLDAGLMTEAVGKILACRFALLVRKGDVLDKTEPISVATKYPGALDVFAKANDIALAKL